MDVEMEEDYDALNTETFGADGLDDFDWEEDHELYSRIIELEKQDNSLMGSGSDIEIVEESEEVPEEQNHSANDSEYVLFPTEHDNYPFSIPHYKDFETFLRLSNENYVDVQKTQSSSTFNSSYEAESLIDFNKLEVGEKPATVGYDPKAYANLIPCSPFHTKLLIKKDMTVINETFSLEDEYAGLMTQREKYWLAGIQLLPASDMDPLIEDYYFTMFQMRKRSNRNKTFVLPNHLKKKPVPFKEYTPLQFENSLGKLQVSSAAAPRKVLDLADTYCKYHKDVPFAYLNDYNEKYRCILVMIEDLFSKLLHYEHHVLFSEEGKSENSGSFGSSEVLELYNELVSSKEVLCCYLCINKGKKLILRFLQHCKNQKEIWETLFKYIDQVIQQDKEDGLLLFYLPHVRHWLYSVPFHSLLKIAESVTYPLETILTSKFGVSVLANMVERAEYIFSKATQREQTLWLEFVTFVAKRLECIPNHEKPVVYVKEQVLLYHLSRCPNLTRKYIASLINLFTNNMSTPQAFELRH